MLLWKDVKFPAGYVENMDDYDTDTLINPDFWTNTVC